MNEMSFYSPTRRQVIVGKACNAHLIPKSLRPDSAFVQGEQEIDNVIGTECDAALVNWVRNHLSSQHDVLLDLYGDTNLEEYSHGAKTPMNRTPIRAKSNMKLNARGLREGEITCAHKSEWVRSHLETGKLVQLTPVAPNLDDWSRIAVSVLHSSYLTMYFHFGESFPKETCLDHICEILAHPRDDIRRLQALRFVGVHDHIVNAISPENFAKIATRSVTEQKHPICLLGFPDAMVFGALLPYAKSFVRLSVMPGPGETGRKEYDRFMTIVESGVPIPLDCFCVQGVAGSHGMSISIAWNRRSPRRTSDTNKL